MKLQTTYTKLFLSAVTLFFCVNQAVSQPGYTKQDSTQIFSYLSNADQLIDQSKYDSALAYTHKALAESEERKFLRGQAYANLKLADILYRKAEYTLLGRYDSVALRAAQQLKDTFLIALSCFQLGQYFIEVKKYPEAEQLFQKSLAIRFEKEQSAYTAFVYNDLGNLSGLLGLYDQQVDWLLKAVRLHQKNKDDLGLAQSLSNLSALYYELEQFQEAINYGKQSLSIREKANNYSGMALSCNNISQTYLRIDSVAQAIHYQQLGLKYAELSGVPSRVAQSYISMSLLMSRQRKYAEAFEYEKKAIVILESLDQNMLANRYIAAAFYSNILKDSAGAVAYFNKSETLAKTLGSKPVLRNVYLYLSNFYKGRQNFSAAYDNYTKYILYRDSLINSETNTRIATLQTQFETEKKDFEIIRLHTLQRIKELEIEKQKAIIAGNTAEALQKQNEIDLLSKSKELQEQQLQLQSDELEKQSLLSKNNEQRLQLAEKEKLLQQKQISNQTLLRNLMLGGFALLLLLGYLSFNRYQLKKKLEQQSSLLAMRNNISENLHDDIGASLSNINILTELARRNLNNASKSTEYLDKAGEDIQRISESLSDIVWNINPKYDELEKLFIRMKRYAADMMDGKNISYEMNFDEAAENLSFSMEKRRNFYLIFKEAVNNLVKYSKASSAEISVQTNQHVLKLLIQDNGTGFQHSQVTMGNGLSNMKKRADDLGASLQIQSAPGKGTVVSLTMSIT